MSPHEQRIAITVFQFQHQPNKVIDVVIKLQHLVVNLLYQGSTLGKSSVKQAYTY